MEFWIALTLGSKQAPLSLFKCFGQGLGVKPDNDVATLMYGAALKLTPKDCAEVLKKIPNDKKPVIDKSMNPRVEVLVKLVKDTHAKIPTEGVSMEVVDNQMTKFNHAIKLPSGKLIQSCFTDSTSKERDLKSKTLELIKNLSSQNKSTTTNHISKKANTALSRVGCSIYK